MTLPLERVRQVAPGCLSDFRMDELSAGEPSKADAAEARAHIQTCGACRERFDELIEEARTFHGVPWPRPLSVEPAARTRLPRRRLAFGAGVMALAASIALMLRSGSDVADGALRTKGATGRIAAFVQRGGQATLAGPRERVHPGDVVQLVYSLGEARHVVVVGVDAIGQTTLFYPTGDEPLRLPVAENEKFPFAIALDSMLGEERIFALFCTEPVVPEAMRRGFASSWSSGAMPAHCSTDELTFVKEPL